MAWASDATVRGVVRAMDKAVIATELVAPVKEIRFREGEAFKKGDVIIEFDCRRYEAELKSIAAEARGARLTFEANQKLLKHNAIGTSEVEISRAKFDEANARLDAIKIRAAQCKIRAPYDGRVVRNHIHAYELPKANDPIIEIVGEKTLEIDLLIPSKWLVWLRPGRLFKFGVDETQETYQARIERISAVVDPISQTARLSAAFLELHDEIRPGMSGEAAFSEFDNLSQVEGHGQSSK